MKTILLLALLLASAPEWRRVVSNDDATYYVADQRTDRTEREVKTWEKVVPLSTETGRKYIETIRDELRGRGVRDAAQVEYMTARHRYRCGEGEAAFEQFLYHDAGGRVVARDPEEALNRWKSPPPDSIAERLMLDACKGQQKPEEYQ